MADTLAANRPGEIRQRALQEELKSLVDLVGPIPLVDMLLERSFELAATDIHLDPRTDGLHVRLRVDGMLHELLVVTPQQAPQVISRIKLMAGMDITERRMAQDGHISSAVLKQQRDVRVGSGPTIHGERLVLRLMPDNSHFPALEQLGLEESQRNLLNKALEASHGMIICAGPVGSGKSTTTYSCLTLLNDPQRSVTTIEDPVERRIEGANQVQIDPKIGFGFAEALRGVLRQDPDILMVGEIRDPETAHIATRASLTGVRVLSTLHAADTRATIDVLREFDIPPMFVAEAVRCVVAQRLLRKVCPRDRETYHPDAATARILGLPPEKAEFAQLVRGLPTDMNFYTGYLGRTGIFEVMAVDDEIRHAILEGRAGSEIYQVARQQGLQTLEQSAINKVLGGVTSIAEMHRVLTV